MENPFAPPQADLAAPAPDAAAPRMPWEDRAAFPTLGARVIATLQWLVRRPAELGPALAAPQPLWLAGEGKEARDCGRGLSRRLQGRCTGTALFHG